VKELSVEMSTLRRRKHQSIEKGVHCIPLSNPFQKVTESVVSFLSEVREDSGIENNFW